MVISPSRNTPTIRTSGRSIRHMNPSARLGATSSTQRPWPRRASSSSPRSCSKRASWRVLNW